MSDQYNLCERFVSINGEGARAGELACFLRFAGCNLNCSYCDTRWANESDVKTTAYTPEEILAYIKENGVRNVTLTGGEPMLAEGFLELVDHLSRDASLRIEIETNGSVSIEPYKDRMDNVCFTLDYKLPGSGMEAHMNTENYSYLKPQDVIKFVAGSREDLDRAREVIAEHALTKKAQVFISPVFHKITPEEIVAYMKEYSMTDVRLQLQLHKFIWDPEKRGV